MKLVWLASYPKSGNTWLRFFLYNYLYGKVRKSSDVDRKIIDISATRDLDLSGDKTSYCKTHFLCAPQHPFIEYTSAFIYILRNPKDVLLSNLNYFKLRGGTVDDEKFVRDFIEHGGVSLWKESNFGSWAENARSWLKEPRFPHLLLRYEDLCSDPHGNFTQVLRFLDLAIDENRLKRAIYQSSFNKLHQLEDSEKRKNPLGVVFSGNEKTTREGYRFMSKGKTDQNLASIGNEWDAIFDNGFIEALQEFGYD